MSMTSHIRVRGLDEAKEFLAKQIVAVPNRTLKAMVAGGLTIQRAAQQLTPVDVGNLKASAFTTWKTKRSVGSPSFKGPHGGAEAQRYEQTVKQEQGKLNPNFKGSPEVEVGFTASYAIYVHENMTANHPRGGQAKFLETPFAVMGREILQAIKTGVVTRTKRDDVRNLGKDYIAGLVGEVGEAGR